jgi:hypothetical protein
MALLSKISIPLTINELFAYTAIFTKDKHMKALYISFLLLTVPGFTSECRCHKERKEVVLNMEAKELFNEIGFPTYGKTDEEIKLEWAFWIAKKENQDCFLAHLSNQARGDNEAIPEKLAEALAALKSALKLWTKTLESEKKTLKPTFRESPAAPRIFFSSQQIKNHFF